MLRVRLLFVLILQQEHFVNQDILGINKNRNRESVHPM